MTRDELESLMLSEAAMGYIGRHGDYGVCWECLDDTSLLTAWPVACPFQRPDEPPATPDDVAEALAGYWGIR